MMQLLFKGRCIVIMSRFFLLHQLIKIVFFSMLLIETCWILLKIYRLSLVGILLFTASTTWAVNLPVLVASNIKDLESYAMPQFPLELVGAKMSAGEVVLVITIDDAGKVNDSLVLEATNNAFAQAAINAVNDWLFKPNSLITAESPTPDVKKAWPRREVLQFNFKRSGSVTTLSHSEAARSGFVGTSRLQLRTASWHSLDSEPQPINISMPDLSSVMSAKSDQAPLVINFVIDRQGHVRVPVILGFVDPALAEIVIGAVRTWRYTLPMQQKKAVAVEVTNRLVLPNSPAK